jgi:4-diphosphocytidyl-2-C-methyl-D-erythritol kinase
MRMTQILRSSGTSDRAFAKLNLYLETVGKRPDGYHELRTLFQTIDLADDIDVSRGDGLKFGVRCVVEGADLPTDARNLAVRAAEAWLRATGLIEGVELRIVKRIPIGGGLGGGSSDAAYVLRALQVLAPRVALPPDALLELARSLGADVPFLLEGGFAQGTGRGDVIVPLPPPPPVAYVLILPPFGTETAKVYAQAHLRLRPAPRGGLDRAKEAVASGVPARIREAHHNDLAEAAMRAYPEMLRYTSLTERLLGRAPCMSGSGSTLFDVPDEGEIDDVVARLAALPGRRVVVHPAGAPPSRSE